MPDGMHPLLGKRHDLIFASDSPMRAIVDHAERIAVSDATVLLTGETGTGKEVIARILHKVRMESQNSKGSFVPVNCGAIPENLIEAELFGHARGAFTGAHAARKGRVAMAEGGTLFLDEIGELPLALQVKLLRLLQERTYEPVGESRTLKASFRLVAATNRDLSKEVAEGRFRSDLFYRLFVCPIELPPLKDRPSDVPLLIQHFWQARGETRSFDPQVTQILREYSWPGNIRELENLVERVSVCAIDAIIRPSDLPPHIRQIQPISTSPMAPVAIPSAPTPIEPTEPDTHVPQLPWINAPLSAPYAAQHPTPQPPAYAQSSPFPATDFAETQGWNATHIQGGDSLTSFITAAPQHPTAQHAPLPQPTPLHAEPIVESPPEQNLPFAANEDGEQRAALVNSSLVTAPKTLQNATPISTASSELPPSFTDNITQQILAKIQIPKKLPCDLPNLLRQLEWAFIDRALEQTGGNKQGAANLLGLRRTTLVEKLRRKKAAETEA